MFKISMFLCVAVFQVKVAMVMLAQKVHFIEI